MSRALWTAYLNGATSGWALCSVAVEITCQRIPAAPDLLFRSFDTLPLRVSASDWAVLSPITVQPGRYILAGPMTLLGPQVTLARVSESGAGTLIGPDDQTTWNRVLWVDLGGLGPGRYVAVVGAYELSGGDSEGRLRAQLTHWAVGFVVQAPEDAPAPSS